MKKNSTNIQNFPEVDHSYLVITEYKMKIGQDPCDIPNLTSGLIFLALSKMSTNMVGVP